MAFFVTLTLPLLAACGGEQAHAEHGHHAEMKGPVGELHSVLAPIWHSAKGPERLAKACDQAKTLSDRTAAVDAAPPPAGASADGYKAAAKALSASAAAFSAACAAPGRPDAEAKFSAFHDAFHKVMEASGGHHDHH